MTPPTTTDAPPGRVIETVNETGNRRFSRTAGTHNGNSFTRRDFERDIFEDLPLWIIFKADVIEFKLPPGQGQRARVSRVSDFLLHTQ